MSPRRALFLLALAATSCGDPTSGGRPREHRPEATPSAMLARGDVRLGDAWAPVGDLAFDVTSRYVDRLVQVTDDDILGAQRALWHETRLIAEPGGAAALAAVRSGAYDPDPDERVVVSGIQDAIPGQKVDPQLQAAKSVAMEPAAAGKSDSSKSDSSKSDSSKPGSK